MLTLHHRKQPPYVYWTALLTVLTLFATLFPALPALANYASTDKFTLSKTVLSVGYATASVQVTGTDSFPFKSDTKVSLFDQTGNLMRVIDDVRVADSKHMSFTINPGLREGRYTLMIQSYDSSTTDLNVMTTYDPTSVVITPGVDRDFRIDWIDPTDLLGSDIVIQYGPINQQYFSAEPIRVRRGVQTATIKLPKADFDRNKSYKFQIYSDNTQANRLDFNNGGRGYTAVDTTPPGDLKDIRVTTISNGFAVSWTNPAEDDLDLVTVQYAEHGTTNWSDGFVVQAPTSSTVLQPLNLAKRYDLRFIKTDKYANWAYQIDNHNGYGYTFDTRAPLDVSSLNVNVQSDTSAYITWYDPQSSNNAGTSDPDDDFHHVNIYLRSPLTDWKQVGRVNKGVQAYTLTGLAPYIDYTVRVTAVDNRGNETLPGRSSNTFKVGSNSSTDLANLTAVDIQQEVSGGLSMKWTSDNLSSVEFGKFKMYYAPANKPELKPEDWKETVVSNRGVKTASLRDMPRGLYFLQMRSYDRHGIEQELRTYRGTESGDGYYVSGTNAGLPTDVSTVRIQPNNGREMVLTWNAASSNGTHVSVYYAERSTSPNWKLVAKVDKRDQRYIVAGLNPSTDYFFKLVAVNSTTNAESAGVVYDNSGYGYNLLNGDTHPPAEVRNAGASLSLNTLNVTYEEPSDPDFDTVKIYAQKVGSSEQASVTTAQRGSNGATLRELLPGAAYTLRLTTVDIYGNESQGVTLTNNGQGYAISGGGQAIDEVRNPLVIPDGNKLTVRFLEPLASDYRSTTVAIKKRTDSGYGQTQTINKGGQTEVTFYNLESNQQYQVRLVTKSNSGKESTGIVLGGDTGTSLLPLSSVTDAVVTPGLNRLSVSWLDPANSVPTSVQVEVLKSGTNKWSEPIIVQPKTQRAVFHGLEPNATYKVRITAVLNNIGSAGIVLDNNYAPRATSLVASMPKIAQHATASQTFSLLGTNTRFTSGSTTSLRMYAPNGSEVTSMLSGFSVYSQTRADVTVKQSLTPGIYKLVLMTKDDGILTTSIEIAASTSGPTLASMSTPSLNNGYSSTTVSLVGTGFAPSSRVTLDDWTTISTISYSDSQRISFSLPAGLQPGLHKITVTTGDRSSSPLAFVVHPFRTQGTLTAPNMRNGAYRAELQVSNLDVNQRRAKVIVIVRRNGQFMETKEFDQSFSGYENKTLKFDFGGTNTPYADGPTNNISLQVFVVDSYQSSPVAEPYLISKDLNL